MRKVTTSYIDMPRGLRVTFMEGNRSLGRVLNFTDDRKIELLRRSHAPIEDHQIVEMALRQRRPGMLELRLTEEQYTTLLQTLRRRN
jgi:hypothetical protein